MQTHLKRPLTARSWDSYLETMYAVLDAIQPKKCFEWGAGLSTTILSMYPSVESVDSVEHSDKWFHKVSRETDSDIVSIVLSELRDYAGQKGRFDKYDFIFVDGRRRHKCLMNAHEMLAKGGAVMLHDAERQWYDKAVCSYKHAIYTDEGSTVTMVKDDGTYARIRENVSA